MSLELIGTIGLVLIFGLSMWRGINMGIIALVGAFLVGTVFLDMDSSTISANTANEVLRITQPTPELSELLQLDPGEPIAEIQRIAHDLAGYPVEIRTSRGGTKNFEYRIEIS